MPRSVFEIGSKLVVLGVFAFIGCGSAPGSNPVTPPPTEKPPAARPGPNAWVLEELADKRVLWVAPHADDELTIAPVLGEACVHRGARCTLLVTTENTGWCPYGSCRTARDTSALRLAEHRAAGKILNAEPVHLQPLLPNIFLPRGPTRRVRDFWRDAAGGHEPLVDRFVQALNRIQPEVVITFDPRHGTSCHPDHRVTAQLLLEAVARSGSAATVFFVAATTRPEITHGEALSGGPLVEPGLLTYDASQPLSPTETGWTYVVWVIAAYPSQYRPGTSISAASVEPERQRAYVIPAAAVQDMSQTLCTSNP
jgi:LmbE family N-acetylglucosaminyl deacetylase